MIAAAKDYRPIRDARQRWRDRVRRDPTPAEISRLCESLQVLWTPRERAKRMGISQKPTHWTPPLVDTTDLDFRPEELLSREP